MTINQLKYMVEVAKVGSISKAAANLFISQSVVSTAISSFEKEIGHKIFIRSCKGVSLTPFGRTFISYVSSIQTQLQQLDAIIQQDSKENEFSLSIANTGYYFLSRVCAQLFERYNSLGIRIEYYEDNLNNVIDLVHNKTAELGVIRIWSCYKNSCLKQLRASKLQYFPIASLDVAITIGPKSPLFYKENDYISSKELVNCPSVMYTDLDSGPYTDIYERLHLPLSNSRIVTTSRSTIYEILNNTDCYYLNSAYPFDVLDSSQPSTYSKFRTLRLSDCSIQSEIAWIKRDDYIMTSLANEIIDMMSQYFSNDINL